MSWHWGILLLLRETCGLQLKRFLLRLKSLLFILNVDIDILFVYDFFYNVQPCQFYKVLTFGFLSLNA